MVIINDTFYIFVQLKNLHFMRKIILLYFLFISGFHYSQSAVDSVAIDGRGDYILENKNTLAHKDFVFVTSNDDYIYSIKIDSNNLLDKKIWLERTHSYKRIKNKQGNWIDYKQKDKIITLMKINCSQKEYGLLEKYSYNSKGKVIKIENGSGIFSPIIPNSIIDEIYKVACYR